MSPEEEKEFFDECEVVARRKFTGSPYFDIGSPIHPSVPYWVYSDFYGLPSFPKSICRTGPAWPQSTHPDFYREPKEARPICVHPITSVWHELGREIYEHLDSIDLRWTTIDPVRFAVAGKEPGPLHLWVGVVPGSVSYDEAKVAATHCKQILARYQLDRKSVV